MFWHVRDAMRNKDIRNIWGQGGSSSSKTVSITQATLINVLSGEGSAIVFRKVGASIENTIYEEFKVQATRLKIYHLFKFTKNQIECGSGFRIDFSGLDDPEKIKGITNYRWVILEEVSEFDYEDYAQITFRLRGKEGLQIIGIFNPISEEHWIKKKIFDLEKWTEADNHLYGKVKNPLTKEVLSKEYSEIAKKQINQPKQLYNERTKLVEEYPSDTVLFKSTYKNNFWVVGSPCGTYGFYDRQTIANYEKYKINDPTYYSIYALGDWGTIKTGGEYLHAFNSGKHRLKRPFINRLPVHISIDNNVLPYISISFWQVDEYHHNEDCACGKDGLDYTELFQFHEICAEDPFNTASKAGEAARLYLEEIGYNDVIYLYGDASTKSGNTIDDEKRSFFDKFIDKLEETYTVEDRIPKSNPSVSMSGEFVNAILSGMIDELGMAIDESCTKSIDDYEKTKKDVNGGILKKRIKNKLTEQTYEEHGHLTDAMRYVVVRVFEEEYTRFSNRRKRNLYKDKDAMQYFNSETKVEYKNRIVFVTPDCERKMVVVTIGLHDYADVLSVVYRDGMDEPILEEELKVKPEYTVFECNKSYFPIIHSLRGKGFEVRAKLDESNKVKRISANDGLIKSKFRFRSDYEISEDYISFMNNIMDYNGKENYEALNILSLASMHLNRTYFNN